MAHIFAVKGTFIQFLHRPDIFDVDGAEGLFPCGAESLSVMLMLITITVQNKYKNITDAVYHQ